jgi:hypothetical protein
MTTCPAPASTLATLLDASGRRMVWVGIPSYNNPEAAETYIHRAHEKEQK